MSMAVPIAKPQNVRHIPAHQSIGGSILHKGLGLRTDLFGISSNQISWCSWNGFRKLSADGSGKYIDGVKVV